MRLIDADALLKQLGEVAQKASKDAEYTGNRSSELTWDMAVKYIKNASTIEPEQTTRKWIPLRTRPMDEDERKEWSEKLGYELEDYEAVIYTSLPDDGQDVLICLRSGDIRIDTFLEDDRGCYFDMHDIEDVVAWMPLPKPWEGEE